MRGARVTGAIVRGARPPACGAYTCDVCGRHCRAGKTPQTTCQDCRDIEAFSGTHCRRGTHPLTDTNPGFNTHGQPWCRACNADDKHAAAARRKAA